VTRHLLGLLTALVLTVLVAAPEAARQPPTAPAPVQAPAQSGADASVRIDRIVLTAGRSTVLATDFDITRIAVTNPAIADATAVQPREILLDGKGSGTVSLIVWGAGVRRQYDIVVEPGVSNLQQQLQALFPGEDIKVSSTDDAVTLSGRVSSTAVMLQAGEIAKASASKAKVMNLLLLPGASSSQQVMLQVRFAEVNRRAIQELGVNFFTGPNGSGDWIGRTTTQQFAAPGFDTSSGATGGNKLTFSDFLNLFVFNTSANVGVVIKALQQKGYFQSLAEPNLIAYNGQEASFLAGGEFPVPVVQGTTNAVTIEWKEFGVRLKFTPTIAGDTIRLKVAPEVSTLDFNNGITLQGFRIPSLVTRRAQTDVELRDGQSFAIAGLLQNITQENGSAVPFLGSIPIIGNLFKSKSDQKEQTELMVLITPQLVRPLEPDEVPRLPVNPKRFLPGQGIGSDLQGGGGLVDAPPVKKDDSAKPAPPVKKQ
jgi:pilus assembly protein CpaC